MIEVRFSAHSLAGAMLIAIECRIAPVSCNQRRNLANSGAKSQYRSIFSPDIRLAIFAEIRIREFFRNWRAREVSNLSSLSWGPTPTTRAGDPRLLLGSELRDRPGE
jgi:hypothetical protein